MSEVKTLATLVLGGAFDATELGDNEIYPDMGLIDALQQKLVTGFDDVSIELVSRSDLDSVQSELAALREELARKDRVIEELLESNSDMTTCLKSAERHEPHCLLLDQEEPECDCTCAVGRLTAAEQRNADAVGKLEFTQSVMLDDERGQNIAKALQVVIDTLKPTESGASE